MAPLCSDGEELNRLPLELHREGDNPKATEPDEKHVQKTCDDVLLASEARSKMQLTTRRSKGTSKGYSVLLCIFRRRVLADGEPAIALGISQHFHSSQPPHLAFFNVLEAYHHVVFFLLFMRLTGLAVDMGGFWSSHLIALHYGVGGQLIGSVYF